MGMNRKKIDIVVDAIILDTEVSRLSTVRSKFVQVVIIVSVKRASFVKSVSCSIIGTGGGIKTSGLIRFSFFFGGRVYNVGIHVLPGKSPLILSSRSRLHRFV